ncbi:MAG: histidine kinase [Chitinophagaceae bacterium]
MQSTAYDFLNVDGEMGQLTRSFDWASTPLGPPAHWSQALKTTIANMLRSKFPMHIYWGPELTCFYNDAYRLGLGEGKHHPSVLGRPAKTAWADFWDVVHPLLEEVLKKGNAVWKEDMTFTIYRNGRMEDTMWTFCYSPLVDESNAIAGVQLVCIETTDKINAFRHLKESHLLLGFAIDAAELGTFDYDPRTDTFYANARLREWFDLPDDVELALPLALESIIDSDRKKVAAAIQASFDPQSNGKYHIEYTLKATRHFSERHVLAKGQVLFDEEKKAVRLTGTLQDITTIKLAEIQKQEDKIREQATLNREKLKAQEAERNQIATELHDNICQILAAVKIQLSLFTGKQTEGLAILKGCIKYIDEALIETRDISHRMVMPRFAETSLANALTNLATVYNNDIRTVQVTIDNANPVRMPIAHKEALYRIAQEQLNNMQKYSRATLVTLSLRVEDAWVRMSIEDNGTGFDPGSIKPGIGLSNIKSRAESLQGIAEIISAPGQGCSLRVVLPLTN